MYVKVKVIPGAKKEYFERARDDQFAISVKEKAERNMANDRVRELLARHFELPVAKVKLISGHHSRSKIFSIQ